VMCLAGFRCPGVVVRYTEACIGLAHSQHPQLLLVSVVLRVLTSRDLSQICKYETLI
jgi:hypothetical protein